MLSPRSWQNRYQSWTSPKAKWMWSLDSPGQERFKVQKGAALWASTVHLARFEPYAHAWWAVYRNGKFLCLQNRVAQYKEERGFSTTMMRPFLWATWMILFTNSYKRLARETRSLLRGDKFANPSGCSHDRRGLGLGIGRPLLSLSCINLAMEHVPQGGAIKTPTTKGEDSQVMKSCWSEDCVKSKTRQADTALLASWSTPKAALQPKAFSAAVTLALPQKTSIITGHCNRSLEKVKTVLVFALCDKQGSVGGSGSVELEHTWCVWPVSPSQDSLDTACSTFCLFDLSSQPAACWWIGCVAKHFEQIWRPRPHRAPSAASLHPCSLLYAKQIGCPSGLEATPPSLYMWVGTRCFPLDPFFPPLFLFQFCCTLQKSLSQMAPKELSLLAVWIRCLSLLVVEVVQRIPGNSVSFVSRAKSPAASRFGFTLSSSSDRQTSLSAATNWLKPYNGCIPPLVPCAGAQTRSWDTSNMIHTALSQRTPKPTPFAEMPLAPARLSWLPCQVRLCFLSTPMFQKQCQSALWGFYNEALHAFLIHISPVQCTESRFVDAYWLPTPTGCVLVPEGLLWEDLWEMPWQSSFYFLSPPPVSSWQ